MLPPQRLHRYSPPARMGIPPELYFNPEYAVFFTIRAYRQRPFADNAALCNEVIQLLAEMRTAYGCLVGAFCLIPNHLHFVARPLAAGTSTLVFRDRFKGKSTNLSWRHGWNGRLWQSRSFDKVVTSPGDYQEIGDYILENPVRAGLVPESHDWKWSGILDEL